MRCYKDGQITETCNQDHTSLDSREDIITEAVSTGQDIGPIIAEWVDHDAMVKTCDAFLEMLQIIRRSKNPKLTTDEIFYVMGLNVAHQWNAKTAAEKHGVSKQAFQQGVERIRRRMNLRTTPSMKSLKGRKSLSAAYWGRQPRIKNPVPPPDKPSIFEAVALVLRVYRDAVREVPLERWSRRRREIWKRAIEPVGEIVGVL